MEDKELEIEIEQQDRDIEEMLGGITQFEKEGKEADDNVLNTVKGFLSEDQFEDVLNLLEECYNTYNYSIEDKPKGDYQEEEDYPNLVGIWVNQTTNGGYSGDEFAGTISVKLSNDKYFQFYYSM